MATVLLRMSGWCWSVVLGGEQLDFCIYFLRLEPALLTHVTAGA